MALLPKSERMQFWHEHFLRFEAQEKALRAKLLIVSERNLQPGNNAFSLAV